MAPQPYNWNLIIRYISDECTAEEQRRVEEKRITDRDFNATLQNAQKMWASPAEAKKYWDVDNAWENYLMQFGNPHEERENKATTDNYIGAAERFQSNYYKPKNNSHTIIYRFGMAAVAAAVIFFIFMFYQPQKSNLKPVLEDIVTQYGQQMNIRLTDGTTVVLSAGSKLSVPEYFTDSTREVTLTGKAYFVVAHNPEKPFIIHSKKGNIKVLGTRFVVRAYPENKDLTVVVAEGRVALRANQKDYTTFSNPITKNEKAVLNEDGKLSISKVSNIETYLGWTEGNLIFDDALIQQVDSRLERWYAIDVQFENSASIEQRLTASFTKNQQLKEVLDAIALSLNIQYTKENRTVTFYNNNSK